MNRAWDRAGKSMLIIIKSTRGDPGRGEKVTDDGPMERCHIVGGPCNLVLSLGRWRRRPVAMGAVALDGVGGDSGHPAR